MKSYTITVNGTVYDVTVEEKAGGAAAPAAPAQAAAPVSYTHLANGIRNRFFTEVCKTEKKSWKIVARKILVISL